MLIWYYLGSDSKPRACPKVISSHVLQGQITRYVSGTKFQYENLPMQSTEIFLALKIENFLPKVFDIFLIFAQNIDCGHTLERRRRGGSNEYPKSMFWIKNKKKRGIPLHTPVLL